MNTLEVTSDPLAALHSSEHRARLTKVVAALMNRPAKAKVTIRKDTISHTVRDLGYKAELHAIDVSSLRNVLHIDTDTQMVIAEGQVTMRALSAATLKHGLLPKVVPEYGDFTVAGLINGEGIQSSSHRFGVFTHTVRAIEVILSDGQTVVTTEEQNANLFRLLGSSHGTLGIVTAAAIELTPAGLYVVSEVHEFAAVQPFVNALEAALQQSDFLEGVVYGPLRYVMVTSEFADSTDGAQQFDPTQPRVPYYYQYIRSGPPRHVMPTLSYLERSVRGAWWTIEDTVDFPLLSHTEKGRELLDAQVEAALRKNGFSPVGQTVLERERCCVLQDMGVEIERLAEALLWCQDLLSLYPIWVCPVCKPPYQVRDGSRGYLIDVGLYGEPKVPGFKNVRDMRKLQQYVDQPSFWGVSYLTKEEIRAAGVFDYERYEAVRAEVRADDAFLHLDDKVLWVSPHADDPGKPRFWRMTRTYGKWWFLNPFALLVLVVAVSTKPFFQAR